MIDIFSLSVEELAFKIKDAQISSVEVCEKYIERTSKFEKDVKAWAHFDKKILLEKASEADEYRRSENRLVHYMVFPWLLKILWAQLICLRNVELLLEKVSDILKMPK